MRLPWFPSDSGMTCQVGDLIYAETRLEKNGVSCWLNGNKLGVVEDSESGMDACERQMLSFLGAFPGVKFFKMGSVEVKMGWIEEEDLEAIVCPWGKNTGLAGTSMSILKAGGKPMLGLMRRISQLEVGSARISLAGKLRCRFVIHVGCPQWRGGENNEMPNLERCYTACVLGCRDTRIKDVCFPVLGAGGNSFPLPSALGVLIPFARLVDSSGFLRTMRILTPSKDIFNDICSSLMENQT